MAAFVLGENETQGDLLSSERNRLDINEPSPAIEPFGTARTPEISATTPFQPLPSLEGISRTPEPTFKQEGPSAADIQQRKGIATSAGFGLQIGAADTGQTEFASADTAIQVLAGAGTGFAIAGPWGAVAGGLAAGVGAFLNTRASKRRKKEVNAKEARYQKMVQQQIAREDKFRKEERFDRLENQNFNRNAAKTQNQWDAYKDFTGKIMGVLNSNSALQKRFIEEGF